MCFTRSYLVHSKITQTKKGMQLLLLLTVAATVMLRGALALSPQFVACQVQKPFGLSPLLGCPPGTIFVSADATDKHAHFNKVQDAVLSLWV